MQGPVDSVRPPVTTITRITTSTTTTVFVWCWVLPPKFNFGVHPRHFQVLGPEICVGYGLHSEDDRRCDRFLAAPMATIVTLTGQDGKKDDGLSRAGQI